MQRRTFLASLGGLFFGLATKKPLTYIDINPESQIHMGFPSLDTATGPLLPGELLLVTGQVAMGKTALLLNFINNVSIAENIPTLLFSLDLPSSHVNFRMECTLGKVSIHELFYGHLNEAEISRLDAAGEKMQLAPFTALDFINTVDEIEAAVISFKESIGIRAVFIDSVQEITASSDCITSILRQIKRISLKYEIPIVVTLDLPDNNTFDRKDLNVSDKVLYLNQPWIDHWDFDNEETWDQNQQELAEITVIHKQKKDSKIIPIKFIGKYHLFEDLPS